MSDAPKPGALRRSVGFYGLMFMSLGSIIGSGWLLGALTAAQVAGPASILSWLLAAVLLATLALTYAELGATYPVAGGAARFPYYAYGPIAGFAAGWGSWLQAVFIAPIEVLAAITYINSVEVVHASFNMIHGPGPDVGLLNGTGIGVAVVLMLVFAGINLAGTKFLAESNVLVVIWKTVVPFLAAFVVMGTRFEGGNFTAGGGFMPFGFHGVFAALTGGVVFALQGFEQAVQLAGEARDPKRDLARAIVSAMAIGAVLYALLQFVMIGAFDPANVANGWAKPLGADPSAYGAWYTLALAIGAGWLAKVLLADAIISPTGTGIVYLGAASRLSYALGEAGEMPSVLAKTNKKGVPVVSVLLAAVVGCVAFGPFKSWNALVGAITSATAVMYGFGPLALAALHKRDPDRPRTYRVPAPAVMLPAAFCAANLILYWGGFTTVWKLGLAIVVGFALFAFGAWRAKSWSTLRLGSAFWIAPWLCGHVVLGALGRYGDGYEILPGWVDIGVVIAFSLGIFYLALGRALSAADVAAAIAKDAGQIDFDAAPPR